MPQDQTPLLAAALRDRIDELNRLSAELHLRGGTENEPDVWLRLLHESTRVCEVAELGLRASMDSDASDASPCQCRSGPAPEIGSHD